MRRFSVEPILRYSREMLFGMNRRLNIRQWRTQQRSSWQMKMVLSPWDKWPDLDGKFFPVSPLHVLNLSQVLKEEIDSSCLPFRLKDLIPGMITVFQMHKLYSGEQKFKWESIFKIILHGKKCYRISGRIKYYWIFKDQTRKSK